MKVVLIGDSHSSYHFNNIEDLLNAQGHEVATSFSRPGWSVKSFLSSNLLEQIGQFQPEVAVVALGGNNHDLSDSYGQTLIDFIERLNSQGITRIVWLGPFEADPSSRPDVWERHEWTSNYQADVLPSLDVTWVDMRPSSLGGPWRDGVHFSREEYGRMIDETGFSIIEGVESTALSRLIAHPVFIITSTMGVVGLILAGYYYFLRK